MSKFKDIDDEFVAQRNKYFERNSSSLDPKFTIDNWPLFSGSVPIATWLARYEILKEVLSIPGHVIELGVFNGANLLFMAKVLSTLAPADLRMVYGFDSWEGLTEFTDQDGTASQRRDEYKGRRLLVEEMIALHGFNDRVHLVDGLIESVLPVFLQSRPHMMFSYIYMDTDLYSSTKVALECCWGRLSPGGIIAFDEGYHDDFPGEGAALQEFLPCIQGEYSLFSSPFARQPMLWMKKK